MNGGGQKHLGRCCEPLHEPMRQSRLLYNEAHHANLITSLHITNTFGGYLSWWRMHNHVPLSNRVLLGSGFVLNVFSRLKQVRVWGKFCFKFLAGFKRRQLSNFFFIIGIIIIMFY